MEFFTKLFDTSDFPPRWYCGDWDAGLGWLHIISDVATWAAYFTIPLVLIYFARKRDDIPFSRLVWLFAAFILACGSVHLVEAIIFWYPYYRVSGLLKLITAVVSWGTVVALIRVVPAALQLPSLAATNTRLNLEIEQRKRSEAELREIGEALRDSERLALQASIAKSEFLANMSHEIRTPMSAVLGYSDLLLERLDDPEDRGGVAIIKKNGQYLLEIINDILDLSRVEAGKMDVQLQTCDLPQLIGDIRSMVQVRASEKEIDFQVRFSGGIPKLIQTDPVRLRQVLINLLGNAIKFTQRGKVVLTISLSQSSDPSVIEFEVRDTGIGMTPEQQSRLFEPFSQADSSVSRTYGGSGLGLAISKRLVELLGGTISVESSAGQGSVFKFQIPTGATGDTVLITPDTELRRQVVAEPSAVSTELNCRVLVVDDSPDIRRLTELFLKRAGATVVTAENGRLGVDKAMQASSTENPFDLVLMDMQMPEVDGLQATAMLRSRGFDRPIIALTADAMQGDRERCLRGGCDEYLSKPIEATTLVETVRKWVEA